MLEIPISKELYCIFSQKSGDTARYLIFFEENSIQIPMIGDKERIKSLMPMAERHCRKLGQVVKILRYKNGEEINAGGLK